MIEFLSIILFLAVATGCSFQKSKQHSAKHGSKTVKQIDNKNATITDNHRVDLNWIANYDTMLKTNGDKLNPPKRPGDRDGIIVSGDHDIVTQKVLDDYQTLKRFDKPSKKKR